MHQRDAPYVRIMAHVLQNGANLGGVVVGGHGKGETINVQRKGLVLDRIREKM